MTTPRRRPAAIKPGGWSTRRGVVRKLRASTTALNSTTSCQHKFPEAGSCGTATSHDAGKPRICSHAPLVVSGSHAIGAPVRDPTLRERPARGHTATGRNHAMPVADPNRVVLTGENPFIRLSETDGAPFTTNASFWRIITSGGGPGHVLYIKSELTEGRWRLYSDNLAMARWLQRTVQGMLNAELKDISIPVTEA